jgi:hypothetical protein
MPRLTPITQKSALAAEHQPVADKVMEVFGHIRGPFSMLLHSPKLAEPGQRHRAQPSLRGDSHRGP